MAGSSPSQIIPEILSSLILTQEQKQELIVRFTKEESAELAFAVELMQFIMEESGHQFENLMYRNSSGEPYSSLFNDEMKKLVLFIMTTFGSAVETMVGKNCDMRQPSYEVFKTYANATAMNYEEIILNDIGEFFFASIVLAQMCTFAYTCGLSKAPNLGIMLICRTHSNLCLHLPLQLWDHWEAVAKRTIVAIEAEKKGSKVNDSSTAIDKTLSQIQNYDTSAKSIQPEHFPSSDSSQCRRATSEIEFLGTSGTTRLPRMFKCPYCSYSCNKKVNLALHMRIHRTPPNVDGHGQLLLDTPPMAWYCTKCGMQFTSYKVYQVHKEVNCKSSLVFKYNEQTSSFNLGTQQLPTQQTRDLSFKQNLSPEIVAATTEPTTLYGHNMVHNSLGESSSPYPEQQQLHTEQQPMDISLSNY